MLSYILALLRYGLRASKGNWDKVALCEFKQTREGDNLHSSLPEAFHSLSNVSNPSKILKRPPVIEHVAY